jgi:cytosine/uracil/thiamine/allantoin permease
LNKSDYSRNRTEMNSLRPLFLLLPLCAAIVAVAAFLHGTAAYLAGGGVVATFVLLLLPTTLSRVTWKPRESEAKSLVPAGHFWH